MSENGEGGMGGGPFTRRRFLEMVGVVGGASAVYETMVAMGLMATPATAAPLELGADECKGKSVLILGAGVAGLAAAYRLKKANATVRVLEASDRIGGRNFTVSSDAGEKRNVIRQLGQADQVCRYDPGLYFEAGPGRIPYHHTALLALCGELGVALEPYIMETRANRFQTNISFNKASVANRRVANDTRGYIAELLDKAVAKKCLDEEINPGDRQALRDLLVEFGKIDKTSRKYNGSQRSGYSVDPGVKTPGTLEEKLKLPDLLGSRFWDHRFYQPEDYLWQDTLFEPVGGMQKIVDALAKAVGGAATILRGAIVRRIKNGSAGVEVYTENGKEPFKADYCISTIPLRLLTKALDNSTFDKDFVAAVGTVPLSNSCKVGWQAERRFWEDLKGDRIFGGISWIDHPVTQVWYPSVGFFSKGRAVLTGTYNFDSTNKPTAKEFGELSLDARLELALAGGERLHSQFREFVPKSGGLSIAWQQVPFLEGAWAGWDRANQDHAKAYRRLLSPDERFFVAGDQMSYLPGWQEGAVLSADHVIAQICGKAPKAVEQPIEFAPSAAEVTGAE